MSEGAFGSGARLGVQTSHPMRLRFGFRRGLEEDAVLRLRSIVLITRLSLGSRLRLRLRPRSSTRLRVRVHKQRQYED